MWISRSRVVAFPRHYKQVIGLLCDTLGLFTALIAAYLLRLESLRFPQSASEFLLLWCLPVIAALVSYWMLGLYKSLVRFMSFRGVAVICVGAAIAACVHFLSSRFAGAFCPRSVPIIFAILAMTSVAGSRSVFRLWFTHSKRFAKEKVIVYGAGQSGISLVAALTQSQEFLPVALIDEQREKQHTFIHGIYVYTLKELRSLVEEHEVSRVFLAVEDLSKSRRASIIRQLEPLSVRVQTVPSMNEVLSGQASIFDVRDLDIEDLLGRDQVVPNDKLMKACIEDKVVLVTGAGGSIGSELCRQIILNGTKKLILLDNSEFALYQIEQELLRINAERQIDTPVLPLLGSVLEEHRIEIILRTFGVQTVYHTAAFKHVPIVEHNIVEGVRNNVFGTWYVAEAAIRAGVETFVLISTDKAVRPTNVMGASKRLAELVLQGLAERQKKTRFCMVRFGNVLGSSGSVVPLFKDQILKGGPVTVTHPEIIRFFMTIPEAAQLVIQAGSMGQGGEVFLLDMGEPVRIADLARKMIHLMGYSIKEGGKEDGDIEIVYTGLRSGEKLYEELLIGGNIEGTEHPRILKARESCLPWEDIEAFLRVLDKSCHVFDCERVRELLLTAPTDYQPSGTNEDLVWNRYLRNTQHLVSVRNFAVLPGKSS